MLRKAKNNSSTLNGELNQTRFDMLQN